MSFNASLSLSDVANSAEFAFCLTFNAELGFSLGVSLRFNAGLCFALDLGFSFDFSLCFLSFNVSLGLI